MEVWEGVDHKANTNIPGSKYKMTYVRPHTYVTPESVSLASLARQILQNIEIKTAFKKTTHVAGSIQVPLINKLDSSL